MSDLDFGFKQLEQIEAYFPQLNNTIDSAFANEDGETGGKIPFCDLYLRKDSSKCLGTVMYDVSTDKYIVESNKYWFTDFDLTFLDVLVCIAGWVGHD